MRGALFGGFIGAGQTCIAGSRILVQEQPYDEFVERLVRAAAGLRLGAPDQESTKLGRVISASARDRILDYVRIGVEEGARLATGGHAAELPGLPGGFFVAPTVLTEAPRGPPEIKRLIGFYAALPDGARGEVAADRLVPADR